MELDQNHQLYRLSETIDWFQLDVEIRKNHDISDKYTSRFIAGLLYLKSMSGFSSKEVVTKWLACPYWRYFCDAEDAKKHDGFPYTPAVIDIWDREFSGNGYNLLIGALLKSQVRNNLTIH